MITVEDLTVILFFIINLLGSFITFFGKRTADPLIV